MEIEVKGEESKDLKLGQEEEKYVIGLAFEQPEFVSVIMPFLKLEFFSLYQTGFVFALLNHHFKKHGYLISRQLCKDIALKELTADDDHKAVLELIDLQLDPRVIPVMMDELSSWAKKQAMGQIYSKEAIDAYENGDLGHIEKIIEEAQKITNIENSSHFFFEEVQELFVKESQERFTTGFAQLDVLMNGGPARGEVFCYMAPTGKGKCHTLESKIIIEDLSRIFELEIEHDTIKLAGFREVKTKRGWVKVCNLSEGDDIIEIPSQQDDGDICL